MTPARQASPGSRRRVAPRQSATYVYCVARSARAPSLGSAPAGDSPARARREPFRPAKGSGSSSPTPRSRSTARRGWRGSCATWTRCHAARSRTRRSSRTARGGPRCCRSGSSLSSRATSARSPGCAAGAPPSRGGSTARRPSGVGRPGTARRRRRPLGPARAGGGPARDRPARPRSPLPRAPPPPARDGARPRQRREDGRGLALPHSRPARRRGPQRPLGLDGRSPALLLDAAFLVPAARAARFRQAVRAQTARASDRGLQIRLTGPWPPYSFVAGRL